ncbi:MAG: DUF2157 domain-containing protein [Leptospiraceae bacterium]
MKLKEKLKNWVDEGLINSSQATAIEEFESEQSSRPYAMYSFIILGVAVISVGLISLIAANWESIPDGIKLFVDFLILISAGAAIYYFRNTAILFYSLGVFFSLFVLASIGLISQVFHTSGEFYQAVALALFLTAPLMILQNGRFLLHLWIIGFCFSFLSFAFENYSFDDDVALNLVHLLSLGSILLLTSLLLRSAGPNLENHSRATMFWALASLSGTAFALSFNALEAEDVKDSGVELGVLLPSILLVCSAAYSFFMLPRTLGRRIMTLITFGLLYFLFFFSFFVYPVGDKSIYLALIFVLLAMSAGITFFDYRFVFDFFLVLAGIRFLIVYFELFEDLATTGIGLIVAGAVIIGGVVLYARSRSRIQSFLQERLK